MDRLVPLLLLGAIIAIPFVLIWGKRAYDRNAVAALEAIYRSAERQARTFGASTPVVSFTYHTYSGVLIYVNQSEHRFTLPAVVAEKTLHELLMYTLKYGFFAYGVVLIPVLAYANYLAQKRSIAKQAASHPGRGRRAG
jgi:hypothetical protein